MTRHPTGPPQETPSIPPVSSARYDCLHCHSGIAMDDVNVANDLALCRSCGRTMSFAAIAPIPGGADVDLSAPPKGVRIEESPIHGRTLVYRKVPAQVWFLIPFTAVWSGGSMTGIYGTQIAKGRFEPMLCLFGLPFLIGSVVLISLILFGLFGSWRIRAAGGELTVTMRLGPFGWNRRLAYEPGARVSIADAKWRQNNHTQTLIQVESGGRKLRFGSALNDSAKVFIAEALRRMLAAA